MTPLAAKIRRLIGQNGPISVADYFSICMADPQHGYYRTRDPFGLGVGEAEAGEKSGDCTRTGTRT